MRADRDDGSLDIPTSLLVWTLVLALTLPPTFAGIKGLNAANAERTLISNAEYLGSLAVEAYRAGSDDTRLPLRLDLPGGTWGAAEYLLVGRAAAGKDLEKTLIRTKVQGHAERFTPTQPAVYLYGPGCKEFQVGPGVHDIVIRFHGSAASESGCPESARNFVVVAPSTGD